MGIAIGFAGIALIVLGKRDANGRLFQFEPASLAIIGSAMCAAGYIVIQKKYLGGYTALEFTCWSIWAGVLVLAPFTFQLINALRHIMPTEPARAYEVIYLGIFPGALAYMAFAYATQRLPAARVMSFLYIVPALAIFLAWVYNKEWPTVLSLAGGALAIGGVALVNARRGLRKPAETLIAVEEA
jgi:drug/metabolite transporter (DMT)-like permease